MGDLSGGQSLRNIVCSALNLPVDRETVLHEFDQIATVEAWRVFKAKYRDVLNSLLVDERLAQQIVDEADAVFQLNRNLFHALEPDVKAAIGEHVFDLVTRQNKPGSTERTSGQTSVKRVATEA